MKATLARICLVLMLMQMLTANVVLAERSAQTVFPEQELRSYIEKATSTLALPGLTLAISRDGKLLHSQAHGKDVTPETMFYIGSISKSFTALAIMQLVEDGAVDLDKSVSTYLPSFTVSDQITVRHLLNQTSGMTEFEYMSKLPPDASFADLIADMNRMTLRHTPGEQFVYFNQNYSLLGAMVETVSGQSYEDYMEKSVLAPLGLSRTSVRGKVDVPGHLSFFGFSARRAEPFLHYDLPAGFITSTSEDLIKYLDALQRRDPSLGVSPAGIDTMMDAQPYGMGWMSGSFAGHSAIHHGGSLPGYVANAIMLTDEGYNIALLINKNHLSSAISVYPELANGIVALLTDQSPPFPFQRIWVFRVLLLFFAWNVYGIVRGLVRQVRSTVPRTLPWRLRAVAINLAILLALIVGIPLGARLVLSRGMTWKLAFLNLPDLLTWLFVGIASHLLKAAVHIKAAMDTNKITTAR